MFELRTLHCSESSCWECDLDSDGVTVWHWDRWHALTWHNLSSLKIITSSLHCFMAFNCHFRNWKRQSTSKFSLHSSGLWLIIGSYVVHPFSLPIAIYSKYKVQMLIHWLCIIIADMSVLTCSCPRPVSRLVMIVTWTDHMRSSGVTEMSRSSVVLSSLFIGWPSMHVYTLSIVYNCFHGGWTSGDNPQSGLSS